MKLLIILLLFLLVFLFYLYPNIIYWDKKMIDHYILIFKFGKMGVGKTGDIAKHCMLDNQDPNFDRVYSSVKIEGTYFFDPHDLELGTVSFPPRSSIYIDELGLIWHSRDFKSFKPELRKWFKMIRQSKCKLTIYSQTPDIDKAIRDLCHEYHILSRFFCFTVDHLVSKKIDVGQDRDGNGQLVDAYQKMPIIGGISLNYMPRYIGLWNSFDPPAWDEIRSHYIPSTRNYDRRIKFIDWYSINFYEVYSWVYAICYRMTQPIRNLKRAISSVFKK